MANPAHASASAASVSLTLPPATSVTARRIRIHAIYGSYTNTGTGATLLTLSYTPNASAQQLLSREIVSAAVPGRIVFEPPAPIELPLPTGAGTPLAVTYAITLASNGSAAWANGLLTVLWSYA